MAAGETIRTVLRHTVLFIYRDGASKVDRQRLLQRLAFLGMELDPVKAGDYGDDLNGGSRRLADIPPWTRQPRFRSRGEGPPCEFDVALHLDFADETALAAYEASAVQQSVAGANAAVTVDELTARVDWHAGDEAESRRRHVRHCAMHVWRDEIGRGERARVLEKVRALGAAAGVEAVAVGEDAGNREANYDWILDLRFASEESSRAVLSGREYEDAMTAVAAATKDEWTARVTHVMRAF